MRGGGKIQPQHHSHSDRAALLRKMANKQQLIGLLKKAYVSEEERRSNVAVIGNLLNNERGALYLRKNDIIRHDMMI